MNDLQLSVEKTEVLFECSNDIKEENEEHPAAGIPHHYNWKKDSKERERLNQRVEKFAEKMMDDLLVETLGHYCDETVPPYYIFESHVLRCGNTPTAERMNMTLIAYGLLFDREI